MEAKRESGLRLWHYGCVASTVGALVAVTALLAGAPAAQGVATHAVKAQHHSLKLDAPTSVALVGSNLFVANGDNKSVTEVKASDGTYVTTISGKHFGFDAPTAITGVGSDLFVANSGNDSVTEFSAAGHKHIRTIKGTSYGFSDPIALASSGQDSERPRVRPTASPSRRAWRWPLATFSWPTVRPTPSPC
jgi:DNA-binding beta-propeller fold protein YncE